MAKADPEIARVIAAMRKIRVARTRESTIESYLVERVEVNGGRCEKVERKGWPDRMILAPYGRTYFAEVKRPKGGRFESLQLQCHRVLRGLGFKVYIPKTKEEVDSVIAEIFEGAT